MTTDVFFSWTMFWNTNAKSQIIITLLPLHVLNWRKRPTVCGVILLQLAGFVNILVLLRVSGQFYNLNSIPKIRGSSSKTQKQERDVVFCVTILRPLSMTTIIC